MKKERINVRDIIHAQKQAAKSVHNSQKFSDFEKRMLMRKSTVKSQVVDAEQPANLPENDLDDLGLAFKILAMGKTTLGISALAVCRASFIGSF